MRSRKPVDKAEDLEGTPEEIKAEQAACQKAQDAAVKLVDDVISFDQQWREGKPPHFRVRSCSGGTQRATPPLAELPAGAQSTLMPASSFIAAGGCSSAPVAQRDRCY